MCGDSELENNQAIHSMGEPGQLQRNPDATCYVGGLDAKVNEELLYELFLQAGPIVSIFMPRDKVSGNHPGYGFVEFRGEEDAEYAMKIMNMVQVYGKSMRVAKSAAESKVFGCGANIYIGNLAAEVDEKLIFDTFSAFGGIVGQPGIVRDADTGESKGYGFVSYDNFEASDLAIECMHNQYLANRTLQVTYALKKDGHGERHGTHAERMLAAQTHVKFKPHTIFAGEVPITAHIGQGHDMGQMYLGSGGYANPGVATGWGVRNDTYNQYGFAQQQQYGYNHNQYDYNQASQFGYAQQQYPQYAFAQETSYGGHVAHQQPPPLPVGYGYNETMNAPPPPPSPPK